MMLSEESIIRLKIERKNDLKIVTIKASEFEDALKKDYRIAKECETHYFLLENL